MGEPFICHRTGQPAEPHIPVRRKTPRPPAQTLGPALGDLVREGWAKARRRQDRAARDSFNPFLPEQRSQPEAVAHDNRAATASARPTTISATTGQTRRERGAR